MIGQQKNTVSIVILRFLFLMKVWSLQTVMTLKTFLRSNGWIVFIALILALFSTIALFFSPSVSKNIAAFRMMSVILAALLWKLYIFVLTGQKSGNRVPFIIASIFLALLQISGLIEKDTGSISFMFESRSKILYSFVLLIGYTMLIYSIASLLIDWLAGSREKLELKDSAFAGWFRKNTLLKSMILILVCWLPTLIIYYPGVSTFDGMRQINQFFDPSQLNNHHPVITTFIMGGIMAAGRRAAGNDFGLFMVAMYQVLLVSFSFAYSVSYLNRFRCSVHLQTGLLIFYACLPLWPVASMAVMKDISYLAVFLLYTLCVIDFHLKKTKKASDYAVLCILALLTGFIRSDGLYIVLVSMLMLGLGSRGKARRLTLTAMAAVVLTVSLTNTVILPKSGIPNGYHNKKINEMLSIPFQATARYVKYDHADLTSGEKKAIGAILDENKIGRLYQGTISDPVKATFKYQSTNRELIRYFSTLFSLFLKHPVVCIDAVIDQTYGYYTVSDSLNPGGVGYLNMPQFTPEKYTWANNDLKVNFPDATEKARQLATDFRKKFISIPLAGDLVGGALYFWFIVFAGLLLIAKWQKSHFVFLSTVSMHMIIALSSPVNGALRYLLPVIAALPVVLILCLIIKDQPAERTAHESGAQIPD